MQSEGKRRKDRNISLWKRSIIIILGFSLCIRRSKRILSLTHIFSLWIRPQTITPTIINPLKIQYYKILLNSRHISKAVIFYTHIKAYNLPSNNMISFYKMILIPKDTINGFIFPLEMKIVLKFDSISLISLKSIRFFRMELNQLDLAYRKVVKVGFLSETIYNILRVMYLERFRAILRLWKIIILYLSRWISKPKTIFFILLSIILTLIREWSD